MTPRYLYMLHISILNLLNMKLGDSDTFFLKYIMLFFRVFTISWYCPHKLSLKTCHRNGYQYEVFRPKHVYQYFLFIINDNTVSKKVFMLRSSSLNMLWLKGPAELIPFSSWIQLYSQLPTFILALMSKYISLRTFITLL